MPVTLQEVVTGQGVNDASVSTSSATTSGEYLVVISGGGVVAGSTFGSVTASPGASTPTAKEQINGGGNSHLELWVADVTADGAVTITQNHGGGSFDQEVGLVVLRFGGVTADPFVTSAASADSDVAPSVSTPNPSDLLICAWDNQGTSSSTTPPASMTKRAEVVTTGFGNNVLAVATEALTSSGPTGTRDAETSGGQWCCFSLVIAESSGGGTAQTVGAGSIASAEQVPPPTVQAPSVTVVSPSSISSIESVSQPAVLRGPRADAGPDQTVTEGDTVTLDGTGSVVV